MGPHAGTGGRRPRPYGIETGCAPDLLGRAFDAAAPGDGCGPTPLSWGNAPIAAAADGGHRAFFVRDIRQSVVALVGEAGDVLERYAYGPDGETLVESAVDSCDATRQRCDSVAANPLRFGGGLASSLATELGAYEFGARFYSPYMRLWWGPDQHPSTPAGGRRAQGASGAFRQQSAATWTAGTAGSTPAATR